MKVVPQPLDRPDLRGPDASLGHGLILFSPRRFACLGRSPLSFPAGRISMDRRLAAILATDVVGYSRLIRADGGGTIAALKVLRLDLSGMRSVRPFEIRQ